MTRRICLFDIDGTLTKPRNVLPLLTKKIEPNMKQTLRQLKNVCDIGYVGGSDAHKIREQLDEETIALNNYFFSQNGLVAVKGSEVIEKSSIQDFLGQEKLKKFINFCLRYLSEIDIPVKRGTFIEYRTGLINVSPIGRNCSQKERDEFEQYDHQHKIRQAFINALLKQFPDLGVKYSIGGQISFDVFPIGWDKTYCLRFLKEYDEIYFFGDKTYPGGNDYEIFEAIKPTGRSHTVTCPEDTIKKLQQLFLK